MCHDLLQNCAISNCALSKWTETGLQSGIVSNSTYLTIWRRRPMLTTCEECFWFTRWKTLAWFRIKRTLDQNKPHKDDEGIGKSPILQLLAFDSSQQRSKPLKRKTSSVITEAGCYRGNKPSSIMSSCVTQALYGCVEQLPSFIGGLLAKTSAQSGGIPNPVIWSSDWQVHF